MDFDLATVIARIKDQVPTLKRIEEAADFAAILDQAQFTADAWLIELDDVPSANRLASGAHSQRCTYRFSVVQWARKAADKQGAAAMTDLRTRRKAVRDALKNWSPDPSLYEPISRGAGRILRFVNSAVLYSDEFITSYEDRN